MRYKKRVIFIPYVILMLIIVALVQVIQRKKSQLKNHEEQPSSEYSNNKIENNNLFVIIIKKYNHILSGPVRKAFLDLLMELSDKGEKLTDQELQDEVSTMLPSVRAITQKLLNLIFYI